MEGNNTINESDEYEPYKTLEKRFRKPTKKKAPPPRLDSEEETKQQAAAVD